MRTPVFLTILYLLLSLLVGAGTAQAAGLRIVGPGGQIAPGREFTVDVVAEGIPTEGLGAVQFRLNVQAAGATVAGVTSLSQADSGVVAISTPLLIAPATAIRSGLGDFFWNGQGANGILVLDNEPLVNGSALFTLAHTNGSTPPSGSGVVASFRMKIGGNVPAGPLLITLSDAKLMKSGATHPLDYTTGATVTAQCLATVPSLLGLSPADALAALSAANLTSGAVTEESNPTGRLSADSGYYSPWLDAVNLRGRCRVPDLPPGKPRR